MLKHMADGVEPIYLALGFTDFRKQIQGLSTLVALQFQLDPYAESSLFLFCNKRKNSIKALRWNGNGFILATKNLAQQDMKFQWPKTEGELRNISSREFDWLLEGLEIDQKKVLQSKIDTSNFSL